jgi:hypothetical protein
VEQVHSSLFKKILEIPEKQQQKVINKLLKAEKKELEGRVKRLDYDKEGKWSKDLIVEVLRAVLDEYEKLTIPLLEELRRKEPDKYPAPSTVRFKFGSWMEARKAVGGRAYPPMLDILGKKPVLDIGYFANLYNQYGLRTRKEYLYARKNWPEIVPPYRKLLGVFRTFTNYKRISKLNSCEEHIQKLLGLTDRLNKYPTVKQIISYGIDYKFLVERFDGRIELREFILELRRGFDMIDAKTGDKT